MQLVFICIILYLNIDRGQSNIVYCHPDALYTKKILTSFVRSDKLLLHTKLEL